MGCQFLQLTVTFSFFLRAQVILAQNAQRALSIKLIIEN